LGQRQERALAFHFEGGWQSLAGERDFGRARGFAWRHGQRQRLYSLLLLLIALLLAETAHRHQWLGRIENAWFDLWHRLSGKRLTPEHVAIVAIDQQALTRFPDDPLVFWTPHIARACTVLQQAGARIIGLDLLFAISPESWLDRLKLPGSDISRSYDAPFRAQINFGNLIQAD